jgi:cytochrome c55X
MRFLWHRLTPHIVTAGVLALVGPCLADDAKHLERMVIQDCGSCHGMTMKGGLGRPLTPEALSAFDTTAVAAIILDGIPGTAMPPWRPLLSEEQAMWMAQYLKSRSP